MIKITGCCIVMFATGGLINEWNRKSKRQIHILMDFKTMFENAAFYLARQQQKTPVYLENIHGNESAFNSGCLEISRLLKIKKYKTGIMCWKQVWEKILNENGFDDQTKELIMNAGAVFFEKSSQTMENRMNDNSKEMEKEIVRYRERYREKLKIVCPVGILAGVMLSIILI